MFRKIIKILILFSINFHILQVSGQTSLEQNSINELLEPIRKKHNLPALASAITEKLTNSSWEDLLTKIIFEPLGMKSVGFGGTGTPGEIDQPWGHGSNGKPVSGNGPKMDNPLVIGPAGTVHCTLKDWSKFIADQLRGANGKRALLKTETYVKLHTPPYGGNYALGWMVTYRDWSEGTALTHAGSNTMNYAVVWMAPKRNFAVLVCTNQGGQEAQKACDETAGELIEFYLRGKGTKR